jgi:hypothetical protein
MSQMEGRDWERATYERLEIAHRVVAGRFRHRRQFSNGTPASMFIDLRQYAVKRHGLHVADHGARSTPVSVAVGFVREPTHAVRDVLLVQYPIATRRRPQPFTLDFTPLR